MNAGAYMAPFAFQTLSSRGTSATRSDPSLSVAYVGAAAVMGSNRFTAMPSRNYPL